MKSVIILGGGRIGKAIAWDLSKEYRVAVADIDRSSLDVLKREIDVERLVIDFNEDRALAEAIQPFDMVVLAVPGFMGFNCLKKIIEQGKNVVDISFFNEDAFLLHELAKEKHVIAAVDCGVAPGLCNVILGKHLAEDSVSSYACYVGGLPMDRSGPFQYKAPFSPIDVIEEYTRPARMRENGTEVIKPALSEVEIIEFEKIGQLEAFNTDGLRTILKTTEVPSLKEKTLRYPGHAKIMLALRESGFFSSEEVKVGEKWIKPIDLTSHLLFNSWKLDSEEMEFTVMKVIVETNDRRFIYDIYDERDKVTALSSMARTTGFTCTSVVRMIMNGEYPHQGISSPEMIGKWGKCSDLLLHDLKNRGVIVKNTVQNL